MPISDQEIAILYHNQLTYFNELREKGIDLKISNETLYEIIKEAYTNTIQSRIFSLYVLPSLDSTIGYLKAVEIPSLKKDDDIPSIEIQTRQYSPTLREIPLFNHPGLSKKDLIEFLSFGLVAALDSIAINLAKSAIVPERIVYFDTQPSSYISLDATREQIERVFTLHGEELDRLLDSLEPSYVRTAQDFPQAITNCSTLMYTRTHRSQVEYLLASRQAESYLRLCAGFSLEGKERARTGTLCGLPVYMFGGFDNAVDNAEILCATSNSYSNTTIAFCTHTPLHYNVDTGFSVYGDFAVLTPELLYQINLLNLRGLSR